MDTVRTNQIVSTSCGDDYLEQCSQKLKVCGHPMRLKLLCRIALQEQPCVSELWSCLDQPQPVISQHLAVLKQKGIVESEVRGNRRVYRIVDPFIAALVNSLGAGAETVHSDAAAARLPHDAADLEPVTVHRPRRSRSARVRLA